MTTLSILEAAVEAARGLRDAIGTAHGMFTFAPDFSARYFYLDQRLKGLPEDWRLREIDRIKREALRETLGFLGSVRAYLEHQACPSDQDGECECGLENLEADLDAWESRLRSGAHDGKSVFNP